MRFIAICHTFLRHRTTFNQPERFLLKIRKRETGCQTLKTQSSHSRLRMKMTSQMIGIAAGMFEFGRASYFSLGIKGYTAQDALASPDDFMPNY